MRYNVLGYLIGEGVKNLFKNKKSTIAALMIMCFTMFVFGIVFVISENVQGVMKQVEEQQAMQVFIEPEATEQQITELGNKIKELEYVNKAEYITKEDALNTVKSWFKDNQSMIEPLAKNNPFKASYVVTLTDLNKIDEIHSQIKTLENVHSITLRNDTINKLLDIASVVKTASAVILILLIFISTFIIANTIKLTVHARRKEISIMKYVGATNGFIRWPFMVEGIVIGVVAALLSVFLLGVTYNYVAGQSTGLVENIQISLLQFSDMFNTLVTTYLVLGIGIGTIGSAISMRKYLEV